MAKLAEGVREEGVWARGEQHVTRRATRRGTHPNRARPKRSTMFVSALTPELIAPGVAAGADVIILDLEDAVPASHKNEARAALLEIARKEDFGAADLFMRINGTDTPWWRDDVRACVEAGADGLRIAKCESAEMVHEVEAELAAAERELGVDVGTTLLMAALESPAGILNCYAICMASERMLGAGLSGGDFRKSMRVKFDEGGLDVLAARGHMLLACRAAGVQCFDTPYPRRDDPEGFERELDLALRMGFDGKSTWLPWQAERINEAFAPKPIEVARARHIVEACAAQAEAGAVSFVVDDKVIDIPAYKEAERVLMAADGFGL